MDLSRRFDVQVYIVTEQRVDHDGWSRGMSERLLVTSSRERAVAALGTREQGWEVYTGTFSDRFYGSAHGFHGKRRKIEVLEVEDVG
jgi:hypothetical protein